MSDELILKRPVPRVETDDSAAETGEKRTLELTIKIDRVKIGDIRALDAMGSSRPGTFDAGLKVLERYIVNEDFDIDELDLEHLSTVAEMVSEEIRKVVDRKNSRGVSPKR
jgi:hypothetical protein